MRFDDAIWMIESAVALTVYKAVPESLGIERLTEVPGEPF
jgi:hypothetical protein